MRINLPGDEGSEGDEGTKEDDGDGDVSDEYFADDLWPV